jgi:hypothetical protein
MRKNPRRILSPQRLPFRHPGRAELKHSTNKTYCIRAFFVSTGVSALVAEIHIGTSAFTAAGWPGTFYPVGMKPADDLSYYATVFDT